MTGQPRDEPSEQLREETSKRTWRPYLTLPGNGDCLKMGLAAGIIMGFLIWEARSWVTLP